MMHQLFQWALIIAGVACMAGIQPARADDPFAPPPTQRRLHLWQRPNQTPHAQEKPQTHAHNLFKSLHFTPYHPEDNRDRFGTGYGQVPLGGYLSGSSASYDPYYGASPGFYYGGYGGAYGRSYGGAFGRSGWSHFGR